MATQQQQERKVPMTRSNNNLIEQEFDSIREKFESEMYKMEKEMARFRSQLIDSERDRISSKSSATMGSSISTSSKTTTTTSRSSMKSQQQNTHNENIRFKGMQKSAYVDEHAGSNLLRSNFDGQHFTSNTPAWLNDIDSPLIKDSADGGKMLKLRFDVEQYEPDQIVVKTEGNRLQVQARREDTSENQRMYREYNREFLLPDGIDPELIRSTLSADGVLTVEAPLSITTDRKS